MIFESVIYEEELEFYESELALERCSHETDLVCDLLYCESDNDKSNNKNTINKIIEMFKTFIEKCKKYLKLAIDKIMGRVQDSCDDKNITNTIDNIDDAIKNAESAGLKTFKFIEVDKLKKLLKEESDELEKIINDFTKAYIKHGKPKDAEKMIAKVKSINQEYEKKINNINSNLKEYTIKEAKKVAQTINDIRNKDNDFNNIIKRHQSICDETEKLVVSALNSLNKYSEDTGYIQNAKNLKDIIHNSSMSVQSHALDAVSFILKTGIPVILNFKRYLNMFKNYGGTFMNDINDSINNYAKKTGRKIEELDITKDVANIVGDMNKANLTKYISMWDSGKPLTNAISKTSRSAGIVGSNTLKSMKKVSRKNDIKKWKEQHADDSLSFGNRDLSKEEIKEVTKRAAVKTTKDVITSNIVDAGMSIAKNTIKKSDKE